MQSPYIINPGTRILWRRSSAGPVYDICDAYYNGAVTSRDLEMLVFLVKHKVATLSQIVRACYPGKTRVRERLRRFAGWRLVDSFTWSDGSKHGNPVVYFPGPGGLALLRQQCPELVCSGLKGWYQRSAHDIAAWLLANEFFIRAGAAVQGYTAGPVYKTGRAALTPTAFFTAGETGLVMRVIRGTEHVRRFMDELSLYEQLIEVATGLVRQASKTVLLLVCESNRQALDLANFVYARSTLRSFRLATDSDILFKPPSLVFSTFEEGQLLVRRAKIFNTPFDNVFHSSP